MIFIQCTFFCVFDFNPKTLCCRLCKFSAWKEWTSSLFRYLDFIEFTDQMHRMPCFPLLHLAIRLQTQLLSQQGNKQIHFHLPVKINTNWQSCFLFEPHHVKMCLRGFLTRYASNKPAQLQKLARILKLWILQVYISYYLSSEQQRCWSDCADAQADLHLCCSHMA